MTTGRLLGERRSIFEGTELGFTEGPHLYKRDGWYHLLVAEGGTERGHAVVMARSRDLFGPYEVHPDGPVLTARNDPAAPLQRTGHGDLVEASDGTWWMAYLCGRPMPVSDRCVLGRETAIRPVRWDDDGWLRCAAAEAASGTPPLVDDRTVFDMPTLPSDFQWLRTPDADRLFSLTERPGHLRLYGRDTIGSHFEQALVARRQTGFRYDATTLLTFEPEHFQQAAGLVCYYNSTKFYYLHVTADDAGRKLVQLLSVLPTGEGRSLISAPFDALAGPVELRASADHETLRFAFRAEGATEWQWLAETYDASLLSDEATLAGLPNFTGTFVGMACQDMAGTSHPADFAYFHYRES